MFFYKAWLVFNLLVTKIEYFGNKRLFLKLRRGFNRLLKKF